MFKHENFIRNDINIDDCTNIDKKGNLVFDDIVLCSYFGIPVNISYTYGMSELGLKLRKNLFCFTTDYRQQKMQKYFEQKQIKHVKNKHTTINEYGLETSTICMCEEYQQEKLTPEGKLFNFLEAKELKIEYRKNMWDDSPYSERGYNVLRKIAAMRIDRENREDIRAHELSNYQIKKEYIESCRANGEELPDYAQYYK